jgi:hypothetical protein
MRPCCLSGRFEWGDGGIAGEAAVQDLNVPVRQWIVPRRGLDRSCCPNYSTLGAFFQGEFNDAEGLAGTTASTYAPNCGLPRPGTDSLAGGPASAASPCCKKP